MDDPIALRLRAAAEARRLCRLGRQAGTWFPAAVIRPETSGLVLDAPGHDLSPGEEVRVWLDDDEGPLRFEGSVLRVGVTLPSRGTGGLLVGYLAPIEVTEEEQAQGVVLEVRLAGGGALSLLDPPARLVDVAPSRISFEVPKRFPIAFPERGILRLRMCSGGDESYARARVDHVVHGKARTLYALAVQDVDRRDVHQSVLSQLRERL